MRAPSILLRSFALIPQALTLTALLSLVLAGPRPATAVTDDEAKCINLLNKNFQKVASAQGKDINACMKDFARGLLVGGQTVTQCTAADREGKVAKAAAKTQSDFQHACSADIPAFGPTDANVVNQIAKDRDLRLLEDAFGPTPDTAIFTLAADAEKSVCQQSVAKSVSKCQETKLKEFNVCKKNGLKAGTITDAATLTSLCLQALVDDAKGKIAKACNDAAAPDKIRKSIATKCTDEGVASTDLATSFPGCAAADASDLHTCLEQAVECEVCKALVEADGIDASACDAFDDGLANNSCGCGDGTVDATLGEECDDSNQGDGDGCNAQCQQELCGDGIIQPGLGEECEDDTDCGGSDDCNASCVCQCAPGLTECGGLCVNMSSDESNCGACGVTCTNAHGTTQCVSGACFPTCAGAFKNCDANSINGCETSVATLTDCGDCGATCNLANAGETCTTGSCTLTSCSTGFCDEDGVASNGCERDLDTAPVCPSSAAFIGTVSGDTGSSSVSNVDEGEKWLRVSVVENDNSAFGCNDLSATVTLTPPLGTDYDLVVFCDDCTTAAGASFASGSTVETVQVRWPEACVAGFPTGGDSGRDIYIRVDHFSANVCSDWGLVVQGNTAGGADTCLAK